jgi:sugar phosphate permease
MANGLNESGQSASLTRDAALLSTAPSGGGPRQAVSREQAQAAGASFAALFSLVGLALWGLPFYYDFMVRDFGWTRAQVTSGNALSKLLIGPVFGFFAGWLVDRFGPRRIMMLGILLGGAALAGLGSISSLGFFYLFYMLNALGYVFGGPLPCQVLLSRWFDKSRGKAMGFAYMGIGFGGAAAPWIAESLAQHFGWHFSLQMLGVLVIAVAFPFAFFAKDAPQPPRPAAADSASVKRAFLTIPFFLLTLGSMCSVAAVSGTQQNLKLFLSFDRHYAQLQSAWILSLVLGFSIVGRLLVGWLADRFAKKYVMFGVYVLVAAAIPLFFLGQSPRTLDLAAAAFGIGLGGDYMIIPLVTAEIFGVQVLGRLMGVILAATGIAEAMSPFLIGRLRDTSGNYVTGCFVLVGLAVLGALAAMALPERRKPA